MYINKKYLFIIILLILVMSAFIGYSYINSDLTSTSRVTVNKYSCTQSNLYDRLACMSIMDDVKSKYVSSNIGIDFSSISSDTNGKGLYTYSSSAGDTYPIYYYRGAVENNNVKFANFCWKIVRTTSTGGTKLIYNGEPDENGHCTNNSEGESDIGYVGYDNKKSPAYEGYMYGTVYNTFNDQTISDTYLYSNNFSYENGEYTLDSSTGTYDTTKINTNHYTCFNTTGVCAEINYIFTIKSSTAYYIKIQNGKNISTALTEMFTNSNDSDLKKTTEKWFEDNIKTYFENKSTTYENYLEDTVWCNDRTYAVSGGTGYTNSGWLINTNSLSEMLYFETMLRSRNKFTIDFSCSNRDAFTKSNSNGNGLAKYPVGLLIADEVTLAGASGTKENSTYYLNTNSYIFTMSPARHEPTFASFMRIYANGSLNNGNGGGRIRPMVSLNHSQVISSGDGTENNPYIIN